MAAPRESMPLDEFESHLRLSVLTDQEIANWITANAPLTAEEERRIAEAIDLTKGDRSPSLILKDALNTLRRPPAVG